MSRPVHPERFDAFLAALAEGHTVTAAAKAAGVSWRACYDKRNADDGFARAWADAVEQGNDRIEDEIRRRAMEGVERKVFYQGEHIDTVREYSDRMLELLAKSRMPDRYRERYDISQRIDLRVDHAAEIQAARKRAGLFGEDPDASSLPRAES